VDPAAADAARDAAVAARWGNRARALVNAPPNELTPVRLAAEAAEIARSVGVEATVLGPAEIEEQGMSAFSAVAAASSTEPRLAVLRYEPADAGGETLLGLVGKGVTFDSGGLSIKTSASMPRMKADMAGAAAVVCALAAVAELGIPQRIVAVVPACENSIGPHSIRPGDIIESMSGLTVEVVNTDGEGRLLLAEGLTYLRSLGATHLVDLGTLTAPAAFGDLYGALFASDPSLRDAMREAGEASGDLVWPMPLDEGFARLLESDFADIKNSAWADGQTSMGAAFLHRFVDDLPWAHIDFTGPAFLERPRGPLRSRGATGFGVRLLIEFVRRFAAPPS
jgi:leucyl aminopeptidase